MKFTSEDLAKAMGLKIGDRIKTKYLIGRITESYEVETEREILFPISWFLDEDFEIVKPKKKVGDTICREICCYNCPLKMLDCPDNNNRTLFEKLEMVHEEYNDKEIYDILKARLNKDVEE